MPGPPAEPIAVFVPDVPSDSPAAGLAAAAVHVSFLVLADFVQVNFLPATVAEAPAVLHPAPAFAAVAAWAVTGINAATSASRLIAATLFNETELVFTQTPLT
jgi:hypothetical protein